VDLDEARLLMATAVHGQKAGQIHCLDLFLAPNFDRHAATATMALGLFAQEASRCDRWRLIHKITRQEYARKGLLRSTH
jgi:hypothetical protein